MISSLQSNKVLAGKPFPAQGSSDLVTAMALLPLEGTLKKESSTALLRIRQTLHGLFNTLEEFREVETMLVRETAADDDHGCSNDCHTSEASPNSLRLVAGTLNEMVGKLVSDLKAKPEIQKLLQHATSTEQPSCPVGALPSGETKAACVSGKDSRTEKRAAVGRVVTCRHSCEHHPELMDPFLWSTLPHELLELVFARLSIPKIIDLRSRSMGLPRISKSLTFKEACYEKHPKLFGLGVLEKFSGKDGPTVTNRVYDIKSNEWCFTEVSGIDVNVSLDADSTYACDGGLVCYVPSFKRLFCPILVGNPLTDEWTALPNSPALPPLALHNKEIKLMQLVMEEDTKTKYYKVILVCREFTGALEADCYDSKTKEWSKRDSGLVYGGCIKLNWTSMAAPRVFDCTTKTLYELGSYSSLQNVDVIQYAMVKDRLCSIGPRVEIRRSKFQSMNGKAAHLT